MKRGCAGMKRGCRVEKGVKEGLEKRLERRRRQVRGNQTGLKKEKGCGERGGGREFEETGTDGWWKESCWNAGCTVKVDAGAFAEGIV
jgi:hypothetical protein